MIDIFSYIGITFTVFLINMVPAFAPPSFLILSIYQVNNPQQNIIILALLGALASVCGKSVMYHYAKSLRRFIPRKYRHNLSYFKNFMEKNHLGFVAASFLFSLGPLPSNLIFIPAGLSRARLLPISFGFGLGRIISYTVLLNVASTTLSFFKSTGLDVGFLSQAISIVGIVLIFFIDWRRFLSNKRGKGKSIRLIISIDNNK